MRQLSISSYRANPATSVISITYCISTHACQWQVGDLPHRSADLGIMVGVRELQGKGYGAEAMGLLLEYGFATLGLHRVTLQHRNI